MNTKHTPGPWGTDGYSIYGNEGCEYIADIVGTRKTDARLIAAAPDLLEALRMLLSETNAGNWDCLPVELAKAAIAKAEGAQQ